MSLSPGSRLAGVLIADALARLEGIDPPEQAWLVFACQVRRETADWNRDLSPGARNNNPLNLTTAGGRIEWPGQTGTYSGGNEAEWHGDFASFGTIEAGAWACAANYATSLYQGVRDAFRAGDVIALAEAIERSPWDSGHYGGTFVAEVRAELGLANEEVSMDEETVRRIVQEEIAKDNASDAELNDVRASFEAVKDAFHKHVHDTTIPRPRVV